MENTAFDHLKSLAIISTSAIPKVGGILSSLIQEYIPSTLEKRKEEMLRIIQEDIKRIENKMDEHKYRSESFHIVFLKIFRSMWIEKQEEKIEAFRSIILNELISSSENPELDFFLATTDSLTGDHIRMLKLFDDPYRFIKNNSEIYKDLIKRNWGCLSSLVNPAFPIFLTAYYLKALMNDLRQKALCDINSDDYNRLAKYSTLIEKKTTDLGSRYIDYISLPFKK